MQPGTKRIAFGGVALAVVAWMAIDAWLPDAPAPVAPPRDTAGLAPIPEVATVPPRPAAPTAREALAAVLVGCFRGRTPDGATLVERYRAAADGTIEGELSEAAADGTPTFDERMRIAFDGEGWRYHPAPGGVPAAVSFALVEHGRDRLLFAEPAHDYPQTIEYRRRGDALETSVAGVEAGVPRTERYTTRLEPCR